MGEAFTQAEREVWDILDCGPRSSFTCEGLLVHNSGNYLRFRRQWEDLYSGGVSELDDGAEKTAKEPTEKEKDASKCPVCGSLWPGKSDVCLHCGHVRVRRNDVIDVNGVMVEIGSDTAKEAWPVEMKQAFYQELIGYAESKGYKPGWAFYAYQDKIISFAVVAYACLFFVAARSREAVPAALVSIWITVLGLSSVNLSSALASVLQGQGTSAYWMQTCAIAAYALLLTLLYLRERRA